MSRPNTTGRGRTATGANGTGGAPPDRTREQLLEEFDVLVEAVDDAALDETWALADWLTGEYIWAGGTGKRAPADKVSIPELARRQGKSDAWLYSLRNTALAFPPDDRVPGGTVWSHFKALKRGGSRADQKLWISRRSSAKKQRGPNASATRDRNAIKDPDRCDNLIESLAEDDPAAGDAFALKWFTVRDADARRDFIRALLELSAEKDEDSDDNEEDSDDNEEDSTDSEDEEQDTEEQDTEDGEEEGDGSTGSGSSTSKKSAAAKKAAKTKAAKSKAKADNYNNATDAEKKEMARIEWSANLTQAIGKSSKGAVYACGLLGFVGSKNDDLWLQDWEVKWLQEHANEAKQDLDHFLTLLFGVQRLPNVSDAEVAEGIDALEKMLKGLS
jgi:hypothetical protein